MSLRPHVPASLKITCTANRGQSLSNPFNQFRPVAGRFLPEQLRSRIPRRRLCLLQPAPVAEVRQQNPHWLRHRAGQMRNARIRRDHQVESGNSRSRLCQVAIATRPVGNINICGQICQLLRRFALLQRDPRCIHRAQQRQQSFKLYASRAVRLVPRIARPGEPNPQTLRITRKLCSFLSAASCRVRAKICARPRHGFHSGLKHRRQTHQRTLAIKRRQLSAEYCGFHWRTRASERISRSAAACTCNIGTPPRAATSAAYRQN